MKNDNDNNDSKDMLIYVDGSLFGVPNALVVSDNIKCVQTKAAWDKAQQCADMFNKLDKKD